MNTTDTQPVPDPDSVTGWMALGLCRMYAPATFFPSDGVGVDKARKICAGCPVQAECLEHALEHRDRARRVGRLQRARASPHPQAPPRQRTRSTLRSN